MGLDMYAWSIPATKQEDFETGEMPISEDHELHYWRKHPSLHGWMHKLYCKKVKEIPAGEFNGVQVLLEKEDIIELVFDIIGEQLPHTEGFFFGSDYDNKEDDLKFCKKAYDAIRADECVYYDSWW